MHFIFLKYFTTFLFVYIFYYTFSSFSFLTCATFLNASEDIKHIFVGNHSVNNITVSYTKVLQIFTLWNLVFWNIRMLSHWRSKLPEIYHIPLIFEKQQMFSIRAQSINKYKLPSKIPLGIAKSGNFAEGGLLNVNVSPSTTTTADSKKNFTFLSGFTGTPIKNASENFGKSFENSNINKLKNSSLPKFFSTKTLLPTKLNDTGSNLFLGVPEVIHINGTSSIKPRKGVYFNKIVPRKGVENDNGANHNSDYLCVWLGENECYNSKELNDVDCKCCKEGNALGKSIKENYSVNCENCKPVIHDFSEGKHICENVCCYDKFHKTASVTNTQDIIYKNISSTARTKFEKVNPSRYEKIKETSSKGAFANFTKSSKHKPNITKVPYDIESVTEILSKTKQKVFVPIIVSLLLLPLVGILVFVILHKIKEIWDKRYYKRMDFLIDGMYQD